MIAREEVLELFESTETYRVERTISTGKMDKFREAICAFANDMPNSRKNGYLQKQYLNVLLGSKLQMTIPDKPTSRFQKMRYSDKIISIISV